MPASPRRVGQRCIQSIKCLLVFVVLITTFTNAWCSNEVQNEKIYDWSVISDLCQNQKEHIFSDGLVLSSRVLDSDLLKARLCYDDINVVSKLRTKDELEESSHYVDTHDLKGPCFDDLSKFYNGEQPFDGITQLMMFTAFGRGFGDLGDYRLCQQVDVAQYAWLARTDLPDVRAAMGLCVPKVCKPDELPQSVSFILKNWFNLTLADDALVAQTVSPLSPSTSAIAGAVVLGCLILPVLLATILHLASLRHWHVWLWPRYAAAATAAAEAMQRLEESRKVLENDLEYKSSVHSTSINTQQLARSTVGQEGSSSVPQAGTSPGAAAAMEASFLSMAVDFISQYARPLNNSQSFGHALQSANMNANLQNFSSPPLQYDQYSHDLVADHDLAGGIPSQASISSSLVKSAAALSTSMRPAIQPQNSMNTGSSPTLTSQKKFSQSLSSSLPQSPSFLTRERTSSQSNMGGLVGAKPNAVSTQSPTTSPPVVSAASAALSQEVGLQAEHSFKNDVLSRPLLYYESLAQVAAGAALKSPEGRSCLGRILCVSCCCGCFGACPVGVCIGERRERTRVLREERERDLWEKKQHCGSQTKASTLESSQSSDSFVQTSMYSKTNSFPSPNVERAKYNVWSFSRKPGIYFRGEGYRTSSINSETDPEIVVSPAQSTCDDFSSDYTDCSSNGSGNDEYDDECDAESDDTNESTSKQVKESSVHRWRYSQADSKYIPPNIESFSFADRNISKSMSVTQSTTLVSADPPILPQLSTQHRGSFSKPGISIVSQIYTVDTEDDSDLEPENSQPPKQIRVSGPLKPPYSPSNPIPVQAIDLPGTQHDPNYIDTKTVSVSDFSGQSSSSTRIGSHLESRLHFTRQAPLYASLAERISGRSTSRTRPVSFSQSSTGPADVLVDQSTDQSESSSAFGSYQVSLLGETTPMFNASRDVKDTNFQAMNKGTEAESIPHEKYKGDISTAFEKERGEKRRRRFRKKSNRKRGERNKDSTDCCSSCFLCCCKSGSKDSEKPERKVKHDEQQILEPEDTNKVCCLVGFVRFIERSFCRVVSCGTRVNCTDHRIQCQRCCFGYVDPKSIPKPYIVAFSAVSAMSELIEGDLQSDIYVDVAVGVRAGPWDVPAEDLTLHPFYGAVPLSSPRLQARVKHQLLREVSEASAQSYQGVLSYFGRLTPAGHLGPPPNSIAASPSSLNPLSSNPFISLRGKTTTHNNEASHSANDHSASFHSKSVRSRKDSRKVKRQQHLATSSPELSATYGSSGSSGKSGSSSNILGTHSALHFTSLPPVSSYGEVAADLALQSSVLRASQSDQRRKLHMALNEGNPSAKFEDNNEVSDSDSDADNNIYSATTSHNNVHGSSDVSDARLEGFDPSVNYDPYGKQDVRSSANDKLLNWTFGRKGIATEGDEDDDDPFGSLGYGSAAAAALMAVDSVHRPQLPLSWRLLGDVRPQLEPPNTQCLHGFRVAAFAWALLGSTHLYFAPFMSNSAYFARYVGRRVEFQIVSSSLLAAECFLIMSSFLWAYGFFKRQERFEGRIPTTATLLVVARGLRLLPTIIAVLVVFWLVSPLLASGPLWNFYCISTEQCDKGYWRVLSFTQNFAPNFNLSDASCMPWTWQIALDFQLLILLLPFLYLSTKSRKWAIIASTFALFASIGITVANSLIYDMSLNAVIGGNRWRRYLHYIMLSPITRFKTAIVGMLAAFAYDHLHRKRIDLLRARALRSRERVEEMMSNSPNTLEAAPAAASGIMGHWVVEQFFQHSRRALQKAVWRLAATTTSPTAQWYHGTREIIALLARSRVSWVRGAAGVGYEPLETTELDTNQDDSEDASSKFFSNKTGSSGKASEGDLLLPGMPVDPSSPTERLHLGDSYLDFVLCGIEVPFSTLKSFLVIICSLVIIATIFAPYGSYTYLSNDKWPKVNLALYSGVSVTLYSISVATLIVMALLDQLPLVSGFFSMQIFRFLSKLTFSAFLIHPLIVHGIYASSGATLFYSDVYIISMFLTYLALTFAAGFILHLIVERPGRRLTTYCMERLFQA